MRCQEHAPRSSCYSLLYYLNGTSWLSSTSRHRPPQASILWCLLNPQSSELLLMQITDQGSPDILWRREKGRERVRGWGDSGMRLCMCGCAALFFWIAAGMELAEEDGIVWIRRRDFTKRRLAMCNTFWRPWNCYCEKFNSCNSSTESPQIGRIQPPPTTTVTTPTFLWSMFVWIQPCEYSRFGFLVGILQLPKIFSLLWGKDSVPHALMLLGVYP